MKMELTFGCNFKGSDCANRKYINSYRRLEIDGRCSKNSRIDFLERLELIGGIG